MRRLSTGVEGFDELIEGGIPEGFLVAVVGEPGTGKSLPPDEEVIVVKDGKVSVMSVEKAYHSVRRGEHLSTLALYGNRAVCAKVTNAYRLYHKGKLLEVNVEGGMTIRCTPDHSLIALDSSGHWRVLKAGEVRPGGVRIPVLKGVDLDTLSLDNPTSLDVSVTLAKVSSVRVANYEGYVYDLSVEGLENFLTSSGVFVHNSIFCQHFIAQGIKEGDKCIYVTTEESRSSIIRQAKQFGWDFEAAIDSGNLIIIDALMGVSDDPWSLRSLEIEDLINKVIEAKRALGYGSARLVIDSLSAFWLDKPAMARKYSYMIKRVLYRWGFTILAVSQYAVTTSLGFGFGIEHIADGIIRFRRVVARGELKRYVMVEKMRHTNHDLRMYEIEIRPGVGMIISKPTRLRREDVVLPRRVVEEIIRSESKKLFELPLDDEAST